MATPMDISDIQDNMEIWDAHDTNTEISYTDNINYVASLPTTPANILHRLSQHSDVEVRIAVADNKNTHTITAMQLAQDENPDLRYALAENHQIDSGILDILAADENPFVADRARKTLLRLKETASSQELPKKRSLITLFAKILFDRTDCNYASPK